jgi:sec-independent protein translocase protein TatC
VARARTVAMADGGAMPLMDHLRELRSRIFKALLAVVIAGVISWIYYEQIFDFIVGPIEDVKDKLEAQGTEVDLILTGVTAAFMLQVKISLLAGFILASPVWIYQLWAFVTPGLHKHERRYALVFMIFAVPLFLVGVAVAIWIMPKGLGILIGFAPEQVNQFLTVDGYLSFVIRMVTVFGLGFLMPVLIVGLNFMGILPASAIRRTWRWTVIGVFLFAAIATPTPDPFSMLLLASPLLLLILIAFGICLLNDRRRRRQSDQLDYAALSDDEASPIERPDDIDGVDSVEGPEPID